MNAVANILGIPFPSLKTRPSVTSPILTHVSYCKNDNRDTSTYQEEEGSLNNKIEQNNNISISTMGSTIFDTSNDSDDDVVSVVSISESDSDESEASASSLSPPMTTSLCNVSFPEEVVSDTWYRPKTTKEEKHLLFYQAHEYEEMKYEARTGRRRRKRSVKFIKTIVTDVQEIPSVKNTPGLNLNDLYYSETDLQNFLEEFVTSLSRSPDGMEYY